VCPDCEADVGRADPRHCSRCGQRLVLGPLRLSEITGELIGALVSFELPILRTTRDLLRGPGLVARAWIAGKRRTYINPVKFIVIVGLVVALSYDRVHELRMARHSVVYEVGLAHYTSQYFAFFCILLLLPMAFVLRALGPVLRVVRPWLDWYVLGLFAYGLGAGLQLVLNVASLALPTGVTGVVFRVVEGLLPLFLFAWGAFGLVDRDRRWHALAASVFVQVGLIAVLVVVNIVLVPWWTNAR